MTTPSVSVRAIAKHFGATLALDGVDFDVIPGEVHALVGENGAGKSTLVRIIGGVHRPDAGEFAIDGEPRHFYSPHDALAAGIATIPQELHLVPALSVGENLTLDDPPTHRLLGVRVIDRPAMRKLTHAALAPLGVDLDPDARIRDLGFAERQLVVMAKALRKRCHVLILDEPTASLETREVQRLFAVLERMKAQNTAIIYVSHRLDEVVALADRCTVMRDGRIVAESRRGAFAVSDLVQAMTGRAQVHLDANREPTRRHRARGDRGATGCRQPARQRSGRPRRPARQRHRPHAPAAVRIGKCRHHRPRQRYDATARQSG